MTRYPLRAALLAIYVLVVVAVTVGLFQARRYARTVYGTAKAQENWDDWVEGVKQQGDDAPVRRRVPQAAQPPALLLMQEHFWTCLSGALLLTTALYGTIAFLLYGALTSPSPHPQQPDEGQPE